MTIAESIKYVGVDDHEIDLFEGQFEVPNGMAYNSYVILDDKIAVMDSVDAHFGKDWLSNIEAVLEAAGGRKPDYLVVQHMEMDHSANIKVFTDKYPEAKIVASKMSFNMMKSMFGTDFADRQIIAGEGTELELGASAGAHTLKFISAPNVHWPEVIMTYDIKEKVLFAADELTGLIWAAALMRPSKSTKDMELKSLKKKYKSKGFAAGCSREVIERGADQLGWELDKLLEMTLKAMAASEDIINAEMEAEQQELQR